MSTPRRTLLGRASWPETQRIGELLRTETVGGTMLIVAALPWGQRRGSLTPRPSPVAARAAER